MPLAEAIFKFPLVAQFDCAKAGNSERVESRGGHCGSRGLFCATGYNQPGPDFLRFNRGGHCLSHRVERIG